MTHTILTSIAGATTPSPRAGYISREQIDTLRTHSNLLREMAKISQEVRTDLDTQVIRCVFHEDSTPSLSLQGGRYHCFGCEANGDVFDLVQARDGVMFKQAVATVAASAGETVETDAPEQISTEVVNAMGALLALVAKGYHTTLSNPEGDAGRRYLETRGVSPETAAVFGLGYAGPESALFRYLANDPVRLATAEALGLVNAGHDTMAGRLVVPFRKKDGTVVGFTGRDVSGTQTIKYRATKTVGPFRKSDVLFGADVAKCDGLVVLVEGNFDVIRLYQAGIQNVVGLSGSALSREQLSTLRQLAPHVVLMLDMDDAGRKATAKIVAQLLRAGVPCSVAEYQGVKDPAELIAQGGIEAVEHSLRDRLDAGAWALGRYGAGVIHDSMSAAEIDAVAADMFEAYVKGAPAGEALESFLSAVGHGAISEALRARLVAQAPVSATLKLAAQVDVPDVHATLERPWSTLKGDGDVRVHVFADGTRIVAGTPNLTEGHEKAVALHLLWLLSRGGPVVMRGGDLYRYEGGSWSVVRESEPASLLFYTVDGQVVVNSKGKPEPLHFTAKSRANILNSLQVAAETPDGFWPDLGANAEANAEALPPEWIVFSDVAVRYDHATGTVVTAAHNPLHKALHRYEFSWQLTDHNNAPIWDACLERWLAIHPVSESEIPEDERAQETQLRAKMLHWWIGRSLLEGPMAVQKSLLLVGFPGSGKSTLCSTIGKLWPRSSVKALDLQSFSESTYFREDVLGCRLLICPEVTSMSIADTSHLKALVTCDAITARRAYSKKPITFRPMASVLLAANIVPTLLDHSGAIWDRFLVLPMNNVVRHTKDEDKGMAKRLVQEVPAIIKRCVLYAAHCIAKGYTPMPNWIHEEVADAARSSDPIVDFLASTEDAETTEMVWYSAERLFGMFMTWCVDNNRKNNITSTAFGRALRSRAVPKKRTSKGSSYELRKRTARTEGPFTPGTP